MDFNFAQQYVLSLTNIPRKEYMKDYKQCEWYLKRIRFFLHLLGNPENKIPHYIQVTGTSGKGSVCAFLESILLAADKKVASLKSPHPTYIFERWHINGKDMSEKEFAELIEKIKPVADKYMRTTPYDMLAFPELTTVLGLKYFAQKKVEWVVLEVGLGGRCDSTNVIPRKDVAIINTIGLDHTELLGDSKENIAYEKAGIIKKGAHVFTQVKEKNILKIIADEVKKQGAILHDINFSYKILNQNWRGISFVYNGVEYNIKALGEHQVRNAIVAIEAAASINIPRSAVARGLKAARQSLRFEVVDNNPTVILDSAHNPDKIQTTVQTLMHLNKDERKHIHLVVGFSNDKKFDKMINQLSALKPVSIASTRNTINPFRPVADPLYVARRFKKFVPKSKVEIFMDPMDAFAWSKKLAGNEGVVLVTGSTFMGGEVRGKLKPR